MDLKDDLSYYTKELNYLREEGARFAERNPEVAYHLGFGSQSTTAADPHAERIVESFAFLTGKLSSFLDAQFPELVHSLFQMLYPYYLRPIPAKTLVALTPIEGMVDMSRLVSRGTALSNKKESRSSQATTFTTCWDSWVHPVSVNRFYFDPDVMEPHAVSLELGISPLANLKQIKWEFVDFLIDGDQVTRHYLFFLMHEHLLNVRLKGVARPLELEWVGFLRSHDYNDDDEGRFAHIHYLRDYFDYPQRFYYFRIKGLAEAIAELPDGNKVQIDLIFDQLSSGYNPDASQILLNTCVAQNLFKAALEGFEVDDERYEYHLTPESSRPDIEVNTLLEIKASKDREEVPLRPYYRFRHSHIAEKRQWFYAVRHEGAPRQEQGTSPGDSSHQGWREFIRFIDSSHVGPGDLKGWHISGTAMCTNGNAAKNMQVGQLNCFGKNRQGGGLKDLISPHNLQPATRPIWPKLTGEAEWLFLAHLALDYSEFHNPEAMQTLLKLYILDDRETQIRKLEGITPHKPTSAYIIRKGSSIPGECLRLDIDESCFKNELGDISLFTQVLGHFLKSYASINSFLKLEVYSSSGANFEFLAWGDS